ncbi:MAG: amidohydrolase family protein, partial [Gemmatimonadota bacterium]
MRILALASVPLLLASLPGCADRTLDSDATLVISNVNIVDVEDGMILEDRAISIDGDRIGAITSSDEVAPSERVVDGGGRYVIPGLWDMHVHLGIWDWETAFPAFLKAGVLGVREMGWAIDEPVALRDRVVSGEVLGPRMVVAGATLDGPTDDWPFRITIESVDDVAPTLRLLEEAGVDFLKVHQQLSGDVYHEIAKEASIRGLSFVGHVPNEITAIDASNAGQASIEHLIMPWCDFDESGACTTHETNETVGAFLRNGTWAVPTMAVYLSNYQMFVEPDQLETRRGLASTQVVEHWAFQARVNEQFLPPAEDREAMFREVYRSAQRMLVHLVDSDVDLMTGTDTGFLQVYPGASLHDELSVWVEAGVSPLETLQAATLQPAR